MYAVSVLCCPLTFNCLSGKGFPYMKCKMSYIKGHLYVREFHVQRNLMHCMIFSNINISKYSGFIMLMFSVCGLLLCLIFLISKISYCHAFIYLCSNSSLH